MKKIMLITTTCITYGIWALCVPPLMLMCAILALLPAPLRYDNRLYFVVSTFISYLIVRATGMKYSILGRENLPLYPHQPAIIIMNHSSALDIPVTEVIVGTYPHVWLSKATYGNVPLLGFLLKRMHVLVDTKTYKDACAALLKTYNLLKNSSRHALFFPEGTRSVDGKLGAFSSGFVLLAKKLNRPVIPVVIEGIHKVYPKNSFLIDSLSANVKIIIGKPLYYQPTMSPDEFAIMVRSHFENTLNQLS
jgi:1-acyl-sn-glycerol-3-phosphate acyltransferase